MNDLVPWPCAKQKAYMEQYSKECSVCLEEFDPEGDTIHRQIVSPPGCPHYHEAVSPTNRKESKSFWALLVAEGACSTVMKLAGGSRTASVGTVRVAGLLSCTVTVISCQVCHKHQHFLQSLLIKRMQMYKAKGKKKVKGTVTDPCPHIFHHFVNFANTTKKWRAGTKTFVLDFSTSTKNIFYFNKDPALMQLLRGRQRRSQCPLMQPSRYCVSLPSCATPGYQDVLQLAQRHTPSALPQPVSECTETDQGEDDYKKEGEEKLQMSPDSDPVQENEKVPTSHSAAQEEISSNSALVSGVAAGNVGGQAPCGKVSGNNTSGVISQVDANGPNSMGKKQTSRSTNVSPTPNGPGDNCRRLPLPLLPLSSARKLFLDALCQLHTQPYIQAQALRAAENSVPAGKIHCSSR
eukprot:CAMPEP_0194698556 /NCGR_PEP_ID=MMETSP0295-20121207/24181_1 /TAXON_ID=39354 /ORGANISM="Heterosigma akashiwo, Strain CCMP2393" /LENGTH=406 /DNA_ID=CAMNT_0039591619 /DNA_START=307 /DNA_END=1528 /DNA_ORIENTATION=+